MDHSIEEQRFFPFMDEAAPPEMAPVERVAEFEDELQAINYCIDHVMRQRGGLTQMTLADEMKITRAVLTKIKQGQSAIPLGKMIRFAEVTRSYALIQFYNMRLGLVTRTHEKERELQRELTDLREENETLKERYRRVVGD